MISQERIIKFRAWDKEKKKYLYIEPFSRKMPSNWKKFYILEQYTGLKDCNGVEIYEGDIVLATQGKHTVVWHDGSWCAEGKNGQYVVRPKLTEKYGAEVIGNIHEDKK